MPQKILLITPPFTQLNTPYPATAYLKGYLDKKGYNCVQADLSIELFLKVFSKEFLKKVFIESNKINNILYPEIHNAKKDYLSSIETIVAFLQQPNTIKAYQILNDSFLPKFHRFANLTELDFSFGDMGLLDKAKYFATLYIEELGDFIQANLDEDFGFTKYAEKIARTATSFLPIEKKLNAEPSLIIEELIALIHLKIKKEKPTLIGFTIPFPGNLYSALRCAQFIKANYPKIKITFGGGYCNTELRSLKDTTIFKYVDYITLDDGEASVAKLIDLQNEETSQDQLIRTFVLENNSVKYITNNPALKHKDLPAPSYEGLPLEDYVAFLDVLNPMHRMWSDGRWNKLTISHGCYWAQCSFCDVSLDYIGRYENTTAEDLVNKMEQLIDQTGEIGFHFVDEAAPPKMLRALSEEIIKRNIKVIWWTNVRFEKTFSPALCKIMAQAGCIAVTGGLEVASDRLLKLMKKGVNINQVAKVGQNFSDHGILVHAYLMYGFPTQTKQETIDAVEIVRQLFVNGCIQSGFWHLFTATAHSPVGLNPKKYGIKITGPKFEGFADNDLFHTDPTGTNHDQFSEGLKTSLFNFMNGAGLDWDPRDWFQFKTPATKIDPNLIYNTLNKH